MSMNPPTQLPNMKPLNTFNSSDIKLATSINSISQPSETKTFFQNNIDMDEMRRGNSGLVIKSENNEQMNKQNSVSAVSRTKNIKGGKKISVAEMAKQLAKEREASFKGNANRPRF